MITGVSSAMPVGGGTMSCPYFRKSEDSFRGASEFHGVGGEWTVARQRLHWDILEAFRDAAGEIGIPRRDDFNDGNNEGSGFFEVNQRNGVRWTAAKAFLRPVHSRQNLRVVTGALVTEVTTEGRRATGVRYTQGGSEQVARADDQVILAAGAINSPKLLELSGIGDPEVLTRHGIAVSHALPGVGRNLQDHLQIRTVFRVTGAHTLNQLANSRLGKISMALDTPFFAVGRCRWLRANSASFRGATRLWRLRILSTTSSRSAPKSWATRSMPSRPSRSRSATSGRRAAEPATSGVVIPLTSRQSAPTTSALKGTGMLRSRPFARLEGWQPPRRFAATRRRRSARLRCDGGCRSSSRHRKHRHNDLSPGRHLSDGQRWQCRRRRSAPRPRPRWPSRRRCLHHADDHFRQYGVPRRNDCGKGRGSN